jgi:hypothetical protein
MSTYKEEIEQEKRDKQCALYKIPPKSMLRKPVSKETIEKNISSAKTEIAETIKNNSKISRAEAMDILELIKDMQEEIQQPKEEKKKTQGKRQNLITKNNVNIQRRNRTGKKR